MNIFDTIKIMLLIGIYVGLLLTYIKISEIEAMLIDLILKIDLQRDDSAKSEDKE